MEGLFLLGVIFYICSFFFTIISVFIINTIISFRNKKQNKKKNIRESLLAIVSNLLLVLIFPIEITIIFSNTISLGDAINTEIWFIFSFYVLLGSLIIFLLFYKKIIKTLFIPSLIIILIPILTLISFSKYDNLNSELKYKNYRLTKAIYKGDIEAVKKALEKEIEYINLKTYGGAGETPLILAINQSQWEIAKLLIEKGADVNSKDNNNETSLFCAVKNNNPNLDFIKFLIEKGADLNLSNSLYETVLYKVVCKDKINYDLVKLLIDKGADVNETLDNGDTILIKFVSKSDINIVSLFIKNGADVNIKNRYGYTALMNASMSGNIEIVKLLLKNGANVNAKNNEGKTALTFSIENNYPEVTRLLKQAGAKE